MEWHYKVLDVVVLKGASAVKRASQLRWTSHIQRIAGLWDNIDILWKAELQKKEKKIAVAVLPVGH